MATENFGGYPNMRARPIYNVYLHPQQLGSMLAQENSYWWAPVYVGWLVNGEGSSLIPTSDGVCHPL